MGYQKLDYTCKAVAVILPASLGKSGQVWVPHAPGCPVAAQIVDALHRALMKVSES